jgi:serine O-acetyltransferase
MQPDQRPVVVPPRPQPGPMSIRALLRADARRDGSQHLATAAVRALGTVRFQAVVLVRVAAWLHQRIPGAASLIKYLNSVLTGCDIAAASRIGAGLRLYHPIGVVIGPDVVMGTNCSVQQNVTLGYGGFGSPTLEDDVFVGPGAVILGGITVGQGARVGANAVVTTDIPSYQLWAGVPARFIRDIRP